MRRWWRLFVPLWLCASAVEAQAIEIPLEYKINEGRLTGPKIASVKVADFDMLAAGARPAPLSIDLGTSDVTKGLIRNDDDPSTAGDFGGRACRYNPAGRGAGFFADQAYSKKGTKPEFYIVVEYFDDATSGSSLTMGYMSGPGFQMGMSGEFQTVNGPYYQGTRTWRKHQFHITDAKWDRRQSMSGRKPASDFWFIVEGTTAYMPSGFGAPEVFAAPLSGNWKMPQTLAPRPRYIMTKFGDKERAILIDRKGTSETVYNRIYFDANGDHDFTNEPPIDGPTPPPDMMGAEIAFPPISTEIEVDGRRTPYRFDLRLYSAQMPDSVPQPPTELLWEFEQSLRAYIHPACHYAGKVDLGGKQYNIALGDSNCNGRFDDVCSATEGTDLIYPMGDTFHLSDEPLDEARSLILGTHLWTNGQLLTVKLLDRKIVLTPANEALATLKLTSECERIQLQSENQQQSIMAFKPSREMQVPPGKYRFYTYSMERTDADGGAWRVMGQATKKMPFVVASTTGESAGAASNALKFGEPFVSKITLPDLQVVNTAWQAQERRRKSWLVRLFEDEESPTSPQQQRQSVSINFALEGAGGEFVTSLERYRPGTTKISVTGGNWTAKPAAIEMSQRVTGRPKEPQYKVMKPDGELVASGQLEYG